MRAPSANASKIASLFNVTAAASSTVAAGHVEVLLGADATLPNVSASATRHAHAVEFGRAARPDHRAAGRRGQRE